MLSSLQFTKNLAAIGFLLVLILGTATTTLLLSPITPVDLAMGGSTAGAYTDADSEILSNFVPLELIDTAPQSDAYTTQLVKVGERSYNYFVKIFPRKSGELKFSGLEIRNRNSASVNVTFSASLPAVAASSVSIYVGDLDNRFALHTASPQLTRNRVLAIPAKDAKGMQFSFDYNQELAYPLEAALQVVF
ncbi:hypothetical protein KC640_02965 [Candidatus Dojkabacteria bacterium]|uniref:Uncharacterized protein n=1 Tax=Candidatus Dojkabacteria bacterium TaxID=2099670 RepID=A0A955I5Y1_9BACT|nr:hypothetical protein [Candidatus Dojkabacteria bacterium]